MSNTLQHLSKDEKIKYVKSIMEKLDKETGLDISNIKIFVSGSFKRTIGNYSFYTDTDILNKTKFSEHVSFKFARYLFDCYTEDIIEDIIKHEYAHAMSSMVQWNAGHGELFKENCKKIGGTEIDHTIASNPVSNYYKLICLDCGKKVGKRYTKKSLDKALEDNISICCKSRMTYKEIGNVKR